MANSAEPLSRDHLNVGEVVPPAVPPACTSTRYSWFSTPR
jgi:hypothetical protein